MFESIIRITACITAIVLMSTFCFALVAWVIVFIKACA